MRSATFVARTIDVEQKHLGEMLKRAHAASRRFVRRDSAELQHLQRRRFQRSQRQAIKADHQLVLEHGKPLIFGKNRDKGIRMNGQRAEVVQLGNGVTRSDLVVHDETNLALAFMLANFEPPMPTPVGVFYAVNRPTYDGVANHQLQDSRAKQGEGDLKALLHRGDVWTVN